jgi:hypothetical protein
VAGETLDNPLRGIFGDALAGGSVLIFSAIVGWWLARSGRGWPVVVLRVWLTHVVRRVLTLRSWVGKALLIMVNNSMVCLLLAWAGSWGRFAWLVVFAVGGSLGMAISQLHLFADEEPDIEQLDERDRRMLLLGFGLNLLELPAILIAAGLCLAQGAFSDTIDLPTAMMLYLRYVLPMLIVAAVGEGLWLTVLRPPPTGE